MELEIMENHQNNIKIYPSQLKGEVSPPISKSYAHRILIASALAGDDFDIELINNDIKATFNCLDKIFHSNKMDSIFSKLSFENGKFAKLNLQKKSLDRIKINCGESGSTLRFLLPIICAIGVKTEIVGEGRLKNRPIKELSDELNNHGCFLNDKLPIMTDGKLKAGNYKIKGNVSSQYISGLLFALPLLEGDSTLEILGEVVSQSYINITLEVLEIFHIKIEKCSENQYKICGNQKYVSPKNYKVEKDWSSACFLIVAGVLCGGITVKGLNLNSQQGDKKVLELLKSANAKIEIIDGEIKCRQSKLNAICFSAKDCPDIVPIMAIALSKAYGISEIRDVDRLKDKECDRLDATMKMLKGFGIKTSYENNSLKIWGGQLRFGNFESFNDHRMVMSSIVGALAVDKTKNINTNKCLNDFSKMKMESSKNLTSQKLKNYDNFKNEDIHINLNENFETKINLSDKDNNLADINECNNKINTNEKLFKQNFCIAYDIDCIKKSYPNFIEDIKALGGCFESLL